MKGGSWARWATFGALLLVACAPSRPAAYVATEAAALRAYSAGRYAEAAELWTRAVAAADGFNDRSHALARAASAWERAGQSDKASQVCQQLLGSGRSTEPVARCAYDNARRTLRRDPAKGQREFVTLLQRYPTSAAASLALLAHLRWLKSQKLDALPWLDGLLRDPGLRQSGASKLLEQASYSRAAELEARGLWSEACAGYLTTAAQFPYPLGALWDDALWHAALLEQTLGRPHVAIVHLRRLLAEEEPASLQGSYERSRFAQAHFRIAEILRDALADPTGAEREFLRVWNEHPTSLLRDDALWNAILLAYRARDDQKACRQVTTLKNAVGTSRFLRCAHLVCSQARPEKRRCPAYVLSALTPNAVGPESAAPPASLAPARTSE